MKTKHITCLLIIALAFCFSGCAQKTFGGKLIDADTLKPIEGAAVVAVWNKDRPTPAGDNTYFKYAKETLTDKDGEWSITGHAGYTGRHGLFRLFIGLTVGVMREPNIIYYKPGYREIASFSAYPYIDKEQNLEGIVLNRSGETREEYDAYKKEYDLVTDTPFIPVKDPEEKLRDLEFSFKYPENVRKIQRKTEFEADYVVVAFKKAETREERLDNMPSPPTDDMEKLPLLYKLINQEHKRFGLKTYRRKPK